MRCPERDSEGIDIFVSYAAGALSAGERAMLELHMETCVECRGRADAQRTVWTVMDDWAPARVSDDFDRRLYQRIASEGQPRWWNFMLRPQFALSFRAAAPVAVACLVLMAAFLFRVPVPVMQPPAIPSAAMAEKHQKLDADQIERTLEDLEMLQQVAVPAGAEAVQSQS